MSEKRKQWKADEISAVLKRVLKDNLALPGFQGCPLIESPQV